MVSLIFLIFVVLKLVRDCRYLIFLLFILASFLISCDTRQEITYWDVIDQNSVLVFETIHPPIVTEKPILPFLKVSSTSFAVALQSIAKNDYDLVYASGKKYPPKYVVAVANHRVNKTDISRL